MCYAESFLISNKSCILCGTVDHNHLIYGMIKGGILLAFNKFYLAEAEIL